MDKDLDIQIAEALKAYLALGVEEQVDYQNFYRYSIVTHSKAIEGSTVTEIENQLLFDEGIAAKEWTYYPIGHEYDSASVGSHSLYCKKRRQGRIYPVTG